MQIRMATPQDFEVYKSLFEAWECSMLYRAEASDIKPQKAEDSRTWEMDKATLERIEEELRPSLPKFLKHISEDWYPHKRIYVFCDGDEVVAFAEMFRCDGKRWKVEEICMKEQYQTQENFTDICEMLLKMPFIKVLDVCVLYDSCSKRLIEAEFTPVGGGFFRRERKEKAKG